MTKAKENAFTYLETSLRNKEVTVDFVRKDKDWKEYKKDPEFEALLAKYSN